MNILRIFHTTTLALAMLVITSPAFALDLQTARAQGIIGEKIDGYIAAIQPGSDAETLVKDVNERRLQEYQRISKENGKPVDVVAKLAVPQIVQKLAPGSMYQGTDGSWKKR